MQALQFALGLAQKAGKLISGDAKVEAAIKTHKAKLILLASDAAQKTGQNITILAEKANIPYIEIFDKEQIGFAIGKSPRASVAILDNNFVKMIKKAMEKTEEQQE